MMYTIYAEGIYLEIPKLGVYTEIVGIPYTESGWDVTWLWKQAGYLQGTAFPTWKGNTVLTSHVQYPLGDPQRPLTLMDLQEKFDDLLANSGHEADSQRLVQAINALPEKTQVPKLFG